MKRYLILALILIVVFVVAAPAFAGGIGDFFGGIKDKVTGSGIAYVLTLLLGLTGITGGIIFKKVISTLKEAGEFLVAVGVAFEDNKLSNAEIGKILKEGVDVLSLWKKTKYSA